jgi:alpha-tubulin suppressor-like RCC1 family protein
MSAIDPGSQQGHYCAALTNGSVVCGGYGAYGQLGNGATSNANWTTPVTVSGISNAVKVFTASSEYSTPYGRSCAILSDGTVKCWGYLPSYGQANSPVSITGVTGAVDLSMSSDNSSQQGHYCVVLSTGSVMCGGYGAYGQLGNNSTASVNWLNPVTVSGISNASKVYVASSGYSTAYGRSCALLSDKTLKCWGYLPNAGQYNTPTNVSISGLVADFSMSSDN